MSSILISVVLYKMQVCSFVVIGLLEGNILSFGYLDIDGNFPIYEVRRYLILRRIIVFEKYDYIKDIDGHYWDYIRMSILKEVVKYCDLIEDIPERKKVIIIIKGFSLSMTNKMIIHYRNLIKGKVMDSSIGLFF